MDLGNPKLFITYNFSSLQFPPGLLAHIGACALLPVLSTLNDEVTIFMPVYNLNAKAKRASRRSTLSDSEKIRHAEELLKEVDSLALLLDEVKKRSERIQAAADAIGDRVFELRPSKTSPVSSDGETDREPPIGPKLVVRARSDRPSL